MKKTIILLCIIFSQLCAYGQYKPMLEPGKVWTQHYEFYTAGGLSDSISVLGTDSVVNGVTYQKLDGVLLPGINFSNVIGNPILSPL